MTPFAQPSASLWSATALPAPATPALTASRKADVAIVGGGITGLSTALHLAERGVDVCLLDAQAPGFGGSGRNGGQVIPGLKYDPEDLLKMFGPARGAALIAAIGQAADDVFALIDRLQINCAPVRAGWIQPAHNDAVLRFLHGRADQWRKRGVPVETLDRAEVARRLGSDHYVGAWVDRRAGAIQPLSYTRGLAAAAQTRGAAIHGDSPVANLARSGNGWRLTLASGATVDADRVVIGTNGYTDDLWPHLRQTVIAANSLIVATTPLTGDAARTVLPGGEVASDSRRLLLYFRRDPSGRLLMGGRGQFPDPASPADFAHLERSIALLFPQIGEVEIDHRWGGRVALTRDFLPHVHEPAPGLSIALGYNGRGVALATTMGRHLAARLTGAADQDFPFPISAIRPIPLHGLQRFYIAAGVAFYALMDRIS